MYTNIYTNIYTDLFCVYIYKNKVHSDFLSMWIAELSWQKTIMISNLVLRVLACSVLHLNISECTVIL